MKENSLFREDPLPTEPITTNPIHKPSLVLGILSLVFALLLPFVGVILGVVGLSLASGMHEVYDIKAGKICCVIGMILAGLNQLLSIIMALV